MLDEHQGGVSPGAAALSVFALGLGGMIIWNAFYGTHDQSRGAISKIPAGATTRVEVAAPSRNITSVTISYDPQVEDIQRELLATGHYRGLVDGVTGKQTVLAIRRYQQDNDLPVTGSVTRQLIDQIRYRRTVAAASEFTGSVSPPVVGVAEPQDVPMPKPLAKLTPKSVAKTLEKPAAPKLKGIAQVRDVQQRLKKLGYDITFVSGEPDEETRAAILKFQMDFGLAMDGVISKELFAALKVAAAGQSASAQ